MIDDALSIVETAAKAVELTWASLKRRCCSDGRLRVEELDRYQLVCYEAAVSASELAAARFTLQYAAAVAGESAAASGCSGQDSFEARMALAFAAETLSNVRGRMGSRAGEFGLTDEDWTKTLDRADLRAFCGKELSAARLAELGAIACQHDGAVGASRLDERCELMQSTFRQLANDVVVPIAEEVHREDLLIPEKLLQQVTELGCFGLSIPERYGGLQSDDHEDNMGMIVVTEELSRGSLGAAGSLITRPEILARALLRGGTEEQRAHWLPRLAAGDPLCCVAVTEPDYGSDVAGMRFRATRTEGGWLLDGTKTWCTFAGKAGLLMVLARTNPDPSLGHRGLSVFMVEKPAFDGHDFEHGQDGGGKISGRAIATIGYRGMHSYECFFDNYFVPESALLGGEESEGKGFYFVMVGFTGGRIQTAARAVGLMQAAFEHALRYAQDRKVFGRPIAEYQLTQVKLAHMAAALCATRQFTYGVGELMDQGHGAVEASMVKLFASRTAEWLTREAMQLHGGMGYAEETAVSRYFLDARVLSIFEGAEEILALKVVARSLVEMAPGCGS